MTVFPVLWLNPMPDDLAKKIIEVLMNEEKRKTFGMNARKLAIDEWNYSAQAQKLADFYRRLMELGKRS